jgi:hypothetical protein
VVTLSSIRAVSEDLQDDRDLLSSPSLTDAQFLAPREALLQIETFDHSTTLETPERRNAQLSIRAYLRPNLNQFQKDTVAAESKVHPEPSQPTTNEAGSNKQGYHEDDRAHLLSAFAKDGGECPTPSSGFGSLPHSGHPIQYRKSESGCR